MKPWKRAYFSPFTSRPRAAAAWAFCLIACAGTVPEPGEGHTRWAQDHGLRGDLEELREGRQLFVQKCDGCHSLPRIRKIAPGDWPIWLDSMRVEISKADGELSPRDDSLIGNYLRVASGHWRDSLAALKRP